MNIKENKYPIIAIVVVLLVTVFNVYERNNIENLIEELTEIEASGNYCFDTKLDKNGFGLSSPTEYCFLLKQNCESSTHNIPCEWVDDDTNKTDGTCVCYMW